MCYPMTGELPSYPASRLAMVISMACSTIRLRCSTPSRQAAPFLPRKLSPGRAGQGLALLQRLQQAHYVEGRRIADLPVLVELAGELGLPLRQFSNAYQDVRGRQTQSHIAASRALMAQAGVQGFPSVLLADGQGRMQALELSKYLGRPEQWLSYLRTELARVAGGVSAQ